MGKYRLGYTTLEESKKFAEEGLSIETADMSYAYDFNDSRYVLTITPAKDWIIPKYAESTKIKQVLPCWSITRIVDILENNGIKVSYEDKSWCLKTNVIENGKRYCFVGGSLPKLVIEMLESKIVKLK